DYRPRQLSSQKIKRNQCVQMTVGLIENPDIVADVAALTHKAFTVGVAAESENLVEYARAKLQRKNLDLIIANDIACEGIGLNSDDNAVTVIGADTDMRLDQPSKNQLARELIALMAEKI